MEREKRKMDSRLCGNGEGIWVATAARFFVAGPPQNDMLVEGLRVGSCLRRIRKGGRLTTGAIPVN